MRLKPIAIAGALALAACSSASQRAADAMAQGQALNAAGQYRAAAERYNYAVSQRDDLSQLWALRARNQITLQDFGGAFGSYRNALDLDRSNREALDAVAQLSLAINDLNSADKYADQILTLDPGNVNAKLVHGNAAFRRGKLADADRIVKDLLDGAPSLEPALVLKSRIAQRRGDLAGALALIQPIFDAGDGQPDLRRQLAGIYERLADTNGSARVAEREAKAAPQSPPLQIAYAKQLLLLGRVPQAMTVLNAVHRATPTDAVRDITVAMFVNAAIPLADLDRGLRAARAEPALQLAVAQYAIQLGDHAFAQRLLAPMAAGQPLTGETSDLHAIYALSLAGLGRFADAARAASAVIAIDPNQPAALTAQALVEIAAGKLNAALRDARIVTRDNPSLAAAAILLSRVYAAREDTLLARKALTDGYNANHDDPAFLKAYTAQLVGTDRADDAGNIARSYVVRNPGSVAGWIIRRDLCQSAGDTACVSRATTILARLHGSTVAMPVLPPEEAVADRDNESEAPQ